MATILFKNLGKDELTARLNDLKSEYFNMRFQRAVGKLENFRKIRTIKRNIARAMTELSRLEKEAEG